MDLIGRENEIKVLQEALNSGTSELIAIYGRRRVGKTYLIRNAYEKELLVELTGLNNGAINEQLENFNLTIARAFGLPLTMSPPTSWLQAFHILIQVLESRLMKAKKQVIFIDEMPWFDTHKSGFLTAFDHFWNNWASKQNNLIVVICGSAASWMIQNIVNNKGGLHNRITRRIRLMPFNLYETELFLKKRHIDLDRYQLLQLYMIIGGIPHYLNNVRRGESVMQAIDRMCFTHDGLLTNEFQNLYVALFGASEKHENVVKALAKKPSGMTRNEILQACELSSGGTFSRLIDELMQSGFISEYLPFGKNNKDSIFKLNDEFSLFYFKFMLGSKIFGEGAWQTKVTGNSWKSWSGLAFENICIKHIPQIKKALGIAAVYTEQSAWRYTPKTDEKGTQIDLLIDRNDNCINVCEIKFSTTEFTIDKKYAAELNLKKRIFLTQTATKKATFITMISTFGVNENGHYFSTAQNQLKMDILFEKV